MVFESLIKAKNAEKHPLYVLFLGIVYGTIGILFDLWLFHGKIPSLYIFMTVFAAIPLMYKLIVLEEKKDRSTTKERTLLQEHKKALICFIALFLGILASFTFWYVFLPQQDVSAIFAPQINEIPILQESIITGRAVSPGSFAAVFLNNAKVLLISIVFSFFFGAGAIFILAWNAALISVALGSFLKEALAGGTGPVFVIGTLSYGFFGYMSHSIFEISSYLLAGLAGGIISVAVIKHDLFTKSFKRILADALWLVLLAIILLFIGALIETSISPAIFI